MSKLRVKILFNYNKFDLENEVNSFFDTLTDPVLQIKEVDIRIDGSSYHDGYLATILYIPNEEDVY